MPKRLDRVAPPPLEGEWDIRFGSSEAAGRWDELGRQLPGTLSQAWQRMRHSPLLRTDTQKPLKGELGSRPVGGRQLPQWQIDVSGGGRVLYCVDAQDRTVWVVLAGAGHPGATEAKGKRSSRNR